MPYLEKPRKRKRIRNNIIFHNYYNCKAWTDLRNWKIIRNPLCQVCDSKGRTTLTEQVHHIKPISAGVDDIEKTNLAYDPDNLLSICIPCHQEIHMQLKAPITN